MLARSRARNPVARARSGEHAPSRVRPDVVGGRAATTHASAQGPSSTLGKVRLVRSTLLPPQTVTDERVIACPALQCTDLLVAWPREDAFSTFFSKVAVGCRNAKKSRKLRTCRSGQSTPRRAGEDGEVRYRLIKLLTVATGTHSYRTAASRSYTQQQARKRVTTSSRACTLASAP